MNSHQRGICLCSSWSPMTNTLSTCAVKTYQFLQVATGSFRPRLCKNVFQCERYSKPDWKSRFYAKSKSADVPINFRFNVEAHTSILAKRFYTLWARSRRSYKFAIGQKRSFSSNDFRTSEAARGVYETKGYSRYAPI